MERDRNFDGAYAMKTLFSLVTAGLLVSFGASDVSAQQRLVSQKASSRLEAASATTSCFGQAVTAYNVNQFIADIEEALRTDLAWQVMGAAGHQKGNLSLTYMNQHLPDMLFGAIENLVMVRDGAGAHLVGSELCTPAYSCVDQEGDTVSIWGFNSCANCTVTRNPNGTCASSCKLCCTHFGATECGCDDNDGC